MIDVAELNEALEDSLERATQVTVTVNACQYRCCGGGWQERVLPIGGQTYTGRVLSIDVDQFLLDVDNDLGKHAEVIANFDDLLDVVPAVD